MAFKFSLERLKESLSKTKAGLVDKIARAVGLHPQIDQGLLSQLEEILIGADVGVVTTEKILKKLQVKAKESSGADNLIPFLKAEMFDILQQAGTHSASAENTKPEVLLIVGVNGTGKTTSIGKLAHLYSQEGKKVLIAAADTFRAAAIDQLSIWAERAGATLVKSLPEADPAAVAFDAVQAGSSRGFDIVIIDTAGRLQTKVNLMEELKKINRVIGKLNPAFPQETLLVLDATTGQNALSQVKLFSQAVKLSGIILTKLDGTAKGGIVLAIADEFKLPVRYLGVGEGILDLNEFEPQAFVEALFS